MWFNRIVLIVASLNVVGVSFMLTAALQNRDPFEPYRQFTSGPLAIEPAALKHFADTEKLARAKLELELSPRERSIIAGLHWITVYADDDKNFNTVFSDFMLLINALAQSEDRHHQREVVASLARASLARVAHKPSLVFSKTEGDRWRFFEIAHSFILYPEFKDVYFDFYRSYFPTIEADTYKDDEKHFNQALVSRDYRTIFDFLVQTSFLHHYLTRDPSPSVDMPPNLFETLIKRYESFDYLNDQSLLSQQLRDQGYLATHIPLVITNYGELPLGNSIIRTKAEQFIEDTIDTIQNRLGDFDLFAEYVQCLKMHRHSSPERIEKLENIIYSLQRPNGSWGSERDFTTSSYTAIHPTGAALMALNESNLAD